uniref:Uncharacterized protein n=1 Tax=Oryzias latipes TaxID=8090 RepID=A0A3B3HQK3_ORYLA
ITSFRENSCSFHTRGPNKRLILHLSPGFMAVCLCCQMPLSAVFNLAITNSIFKQPSRYFFGVGERINKSRTLTFSYCHQSLLCVSADIFYVSCCWFFLES